MQALPSTGKRGRYARLRYRAWDDNGVTSDFIQVFRGRNQLASGRTGFGPAQGAIYWVAWRVPRKVKGPLKFCVRASDEAGNTSERSCSRITVR